MTTPDTPAEHWQTLLFVANHAPARHDDTLPARLVYQLALHGRAVIADLRPASERAAQGLLDPTLPVHRDLPRAVASGASTIVVLGGSTSPAEIVADRRPDQRVLRLAGGIAAWASAGLPVVADAVDLAA